MSDERKRPSVGFWATVILLLPVLYVGSSGPTRSLPFDGEPFIAYRTSTGGLVTRFEYRGDPGGYWRTVYAPLVWIAERRCGALVWWYWNQLPILHEGDWVWNHPM